MNQKATVTHSWRVPRNGPFWEKCSLHVHGIWKKNIKVSINTGIYIRSLNIHFTWTYILLEHILCLAVYFTWTYILLEHLRIYFTRIYILSEHLSNLNIVIKKQQYMHSWIIYVLLNNICTPEQYMYSWIIYVLLNSISERFCMA